jgi:hypothetical protein
MIPSLLLVSTMSISSRESSEDEGVPRCLDLDALSGGLDDVLHRANGSPVATRGGVERLEGGHPWALTDRSAELEGLSDKTEHSVEGNSRGDRGGVEFAHDVRHVVVEESGGGLRGMEAWMANNLNKEIDVVRETRDLKEIRGVQREESLLGNHAKHATICGSLSHEWSHERSASRSLGRRKL